MGVDYWLITGVGIETGDLYPHLDKEKVVSILLEKYTDDKYLREIMGTKYFEDLDVDEYLDGWHFDGLPDLLTYCDKTDSIVSGNDGNGGYYFYYPPSMPWEFTSSEPKTLKEVHERIIKAVKMITTLTDEEIDKMIDDDLYVVGWG